MKTRLRRNPALATAYSLLLLLLLVILIGSPFAIYRIAAEREVAQDQLYPADMNLIQPSLERGDLKHARALLAAHTPKNGEPDRRGFEWKLLANFCRDQSSNSFPFEQPNMFIPVSGQDAVAVADGAFVKVLSIRSGKLSTIITDPGETITALAVSHLDANLLATATSKGAVKLWNVQDSRLVAEFPGFEDAVSALAFSPDGERLAAAAFFHSRLALWDLQKRSEVWRRDTGVPTRTVAFSPDGRLVISGGAPEGGNPIAWDLQGNPTQFPVEHQGWVEAVQFSPDGNLLATAAADSTTIIWDFASRTRIRRIDAAGPIQFSPDSKEILIGSPQTFSRWNLADGRKLATYQGHVERLNSVAFSTDGESVISCSADGTLKVWPKDPAQLSQMLPQNSTWVSCVAFSPLSNVLAAVNYHLPWATRIWDIQTLTLVTNLYGPQGGLVQAQFSKDGALFAVGSFDGTIHVWDGRTFELVHTVKNDFLPGTVAFSRDHHVIGAAEPSWVSGGRKLGFWDLRAMAPIPKLQAFTTNATAVAFGNRSDLVAVGYFDGSVRLWNFRTQQLVTEYKQHSALIWSLAFSQNDTRLAAGSQDELVSVYDVEHRRSFALLNEHSSLVWCVAFSPDGRTLASSSDDSTVKLWNLRTRQCALTLRAHRGAATSVAFSADGNLLASSGADGTVRLWPAALPQEFARYTRKNQK